MEKTRILGKVLPPPSGIKNCDVTLDESFYKTFARMDRALRNWRDGFNGNIAIHVSDENKKWLLALNEETNDLISSFEFIFSED